MFDVDKGALKEAYYTAGAGKKEKACGREDQLRVIFDKEAACFGECMRIPKGQEVLQPRDQSQLIQKGTVV